MLTIFIIMTGAWYDPMNDAMPVTGSWCSYFFVAVVVVGMYMIMNLFVAVLLESFAVSAAPSLLHVATAPRPPRLPTRATPSHYPRKRRRRHRRHPRARPCRPTSHPPPAAPQEEDEEGGEGEGEGEEEGEGEGRRRCRARWSPPGGRGARGVGAERPHRRPQRRLPFVFTASNPIRAACKGLAENKHFDAFIIFLIIFSSGCLALDAPRLDPTSPLAYWLSQLNVFFTIAFTVEATLKIIAYGFAFTPKAYAKSGWNVLDFSIVCVSLLCLFATAVPQLRSLRSLRTLRVLRPLRLLSRNPGMKLIITSLFQVMPAVGNVAGVVFALQLVFAILGLQLFMGGFGSCSDGEITTEAECQGTHGARRAARTGDAAWAVPARRWASSSDADDTEVGEALEWRNELPFSFDSFGATMLTLFVMATGDGWDEVMFVGMDSRGPGLAPQRNDMSASSLYFVAWIFVGCFFSLNLFIGAIVDTFTQIKKENDGSATMTAEQRQWTETMSLSMNKKGARARCRRGSPRAARCSRWCSLSRSSSSSWP